MKTMTRIISLIVLFSAVGLNAQDAVVPVNSVVPADPKYPANLLGLTFVQISQLFPKACGYLPAPSHARERKKTPVCFVRGSRELAPGGPKIGQETIGFTDNIATRVELRIKKGPTAIDYLTKLYGKPLAAGSDRYLSDVLVPSSVGGVTDLGVISWDFPQFEVMWSQSSFSSWHDLVENDTAIRSVPPTYTETVEFLLNTKFKADQEWLRKNKNAPIPGAATDPNGMPVK